MGQAGRSGEGRRHTPKERQHTKQRRGEERKKGTVDLIQTCALLAFSYLDAYRTPHTLEIRPIRCSDPLGHARGAHPRNGITHPPQRLPTYASIAAIAGRSPPQVPSQKALACQITTQRTHQISALRLELRSIDRRALFQPEPPRRRAVAHGGPFSFSTNHSGRLQAAACKRVLTGFLYLAAVWGQSNPETPPSVPTQTWFINPHHRPSISSTPPPIASHSTRLQGDRLPIWVPK